MVSGAVDFDLIVGCLILGAIRGDFQGVDFGVFSVLR